MSEYLRLSPASVRAHLSRLRREAAGVRRNGRDVRELEEQIDEAVWFLRKLSVTEMAIARADVLGRNHG
jgi:hypothetical protein